MPKPARRSQRGSTTGSLALAQRAPTTLRYTIGLHADPGGRFIPAALDAFALPASVDPAWYRLAGIKVWVDSDVPMRGGAVSEPYVGDPGAHGILNLTQPELDALVQRTRRTGLAFLAHATGDRATAMALDAFEPAGGTTMKDRREVRFKIATEPWEFEHIHRLNHRTFAEEIPQHAVRPEGVLVDRFHRENTYVIALEGERLVGMVCVRGRRPYSLDGKLPDLDSYLPKGRSLCELRLLSVEKEYRNGRVFAGLIKVLLEQLYSPRF